MEKIFKSIVCKQDCETGKIIKMYESVQEAAELNSLSESLVEESILHDSLICEKFIFTKRWLFESCIDTFNNKVCKKQYNQYNRAYGSGRKKCIKQFTIDGREIQTFTSVAEATRITGITCIDKAARGIYSHAGGFLWKYDNSNYTTNTDTVTNDELY